MNFRAILTYLLIILIILIAIDIGTGIWFWNRENLIFDSATFNNVATPLLTVSAIIIYGIALNTSMKQNKIILSQSLKPQYDELISDLYSKGSQRTQFFEFEGVDFSYSPLNYIPKIIKALHLLRNNDEYIEDIRKRRDGEKDVFRNFTQKSYFGLVTFLSEFTMGVNSVSFYYNDIKNLIQEINKSQLIDQDKELLKKKIKRLFLAEYFALIKLEKSTLSFRCGIPLYFNSHDIFDMEREILVKNLSETSFSEHYKWFKKELE